MVEKVVAEAMPASGPFVWMADYSSLDNVSRTARRRYAGRLATFHRLETLVSRRRLRRVVAFLLQAHERSPLALVLHPPTEQRLWSTG